MTTTSELMNQTGLVSNNGNNNSTEEDLVITEEGMPSGPNRPEPPQPKPSPLLNHADPK